MGNLTKRRIRTIALLVALFAIAFAITAPAATSAGGRARSDEASVARFLQGYIRKAHLPPGQAAFASAEVAVGAGRLEEVLVYLEGQDWCGSGGCTMLVLAPARGAFTIIGRTTLVRLPIRVLPENSNSRADLAVHVQGGGILNAYEARLRFNGENYPSNPTVPPASRIAGAVQSHPAIPLGAKMRPIP